MDTCPCCNNLVSLKGRNRLVLDICKHFICVSCLIQSPDECQICIKENPGISSEDKDHGEEMLYKDERNMMSVEVSSFSRREEAFPEDVTVTDEDMSLRRGSRRRKPRNVQKIVSDEEDFLDEEISDKDEEHCQLPVDQSSHKVNTNVSKSRRKRGRPKKRRVAEGTAEMTENSEQTVVKRKRGRPRLPESLKKKRTYKTEKKYICEVCDKGYPTPSRLKTHKRVHTGEKPFKCEQCDKTFGGKSNLKIHYRSHSTEKKFHCDECNKSFKTQSSFNYHKTVVHEGVRPYLCQECGKTFGLLGNLTYHMKTKHSNQCQCWKCLKFFPKDEIEAHKKGCAKPPNKFPCNQCGNFFGSPSDLTRHQRVHTGEKPFVCDKCGKGFGQIAGLRVHLRFHDNIRPYACEFCPKAFCAQSNLIEHRRLHTGEKPYQCEYCGKTFHAANNMKKHKRIHFKNSGENLVKSGKAIQEHPDSLSHHGNQKCSAETQEKQEADKKRRNTQIKRKEKNFKEISTSNKSTYQTETSDSQKLRVYTADETVRYRISRIPGESVGDQRESDGYQTGRVDQFSNPISSVDHFTHSIPTSRLQGQAIPVPSQPHIITRHSPHEQSQQMSSSSTPHAYGNYAYNTVENPQMLEYIGRGLINSGTQKPD